MLPCDGALQRLVTFALLPQPGCLHPGASVVVQRSPSETMLRVRSELHGIGSCAGSTLSRVCLGRLGHRPSRGMTAQGFDVLSPGALGDNDSFYERFLRLSAGKDQPQPVCDR